MGKIISRIKKHKVVILSMGGILALICLGAVLSWDWIQFKSYCKEKKLCACAEQKLSSSERKVFIVLAKYMKKTGKTELDSSILKDVSVEELTEVGLKMKACSAEVARQALLDANQANQKNFPGNYNCMRQVLMNELSNEEVLFLQSPQSKNLAVLQNPALKGMYLMSSSKIMKCMNPQIQRQYQEEISRARVQTPAQKVEKPKVEVEPKKEVKKTSKGKKK